MKVLFVSSGRNSTISPIVKSQGESLKEAGIDIDYFTINGRGFKGYSRSIFLLRERIRKVNPDVIHAHYSLCCIVAVFATRRPIVASLMGSDVMTGTLMTLIIRFLARYFWKATIVKSQSMKEKIGIRKAYIIPNGVDFSFFKPLDQLECKKKVGFDPLKKQILFLADPSRYEKNHQLAEDAFHLAREKSKNPVELKVIYGIAHQQVLDYLNAADVVLLTSRWEGSPNLIKEAMACNVPVVSTNVGDVEEIIGNTAGCFVTDHSAKELSDRILSALDFNGRTVGRNNISHLESKVIAKRISTLYETVSARKTNPVFRQVQNS